MIRIDIPQVVGDDDNKRCKEAEVIRSKDDYVREHIRQGDDACQR